MRVEPGKQASSPHRDFSGAFDRQQPSDETFVEESRELVVTQMAAAAPSTPVYREAAFLAHLIATKERAPQTRERRRAEPSEAIAAYRSVSALSS